MVWEEREWTPSMTLNAAGGKSGKTCAAITGSQSPPRSFPNHPTMRLLIPIGHQISGVAPVSPRLFQPNCKAGGLPDSETPTGSKNRSRGLSKWAKPPDRPPKKTTRP